MDAPSSIRAGDSATWTTSLPAYPRSAGWVLRYRLLFQSAASLAIATTASGDDHVTTLSATDTDELASGAATLVAIVERGAERITLGSQQITILPNLATATTFDSRTPNQKALADAEAALAKYVANGQGHLEDYTIGDRRFKFRTVAEIRELIDHYRRAVAHERFALSLLEGGEPPGRVYYRG